MTTTEITTSALDAVIDGYLRFWNETDEAARAELGRELWTADARLVDALIDATGPDTISAAIGGLQNQMPGLTLVRTGDADGHHDVARFGWAAQAADGSLAVAGFDVITVTEDGRISSAIGFFG